MMVIYTLYYSALLMILYKHFPPVKKNIGFTLHGDADEVVGDWYSPPPLPQVVIEWRSHTMAAFFPV